jgi:hypothetical protein
MEVVELGVVVELEAVRALRQRLAVELLAVVAQVDRFRIAHLGRQYREVVLRDAELPGRIRLANPEDVVARAGKPHHVHVATGVFAER